MANNTYSKIYSLEALLDEIDGGSTSSSSSVYNIKPIMGYAIQHVWSAGSSSRSAVLTLSGSLEENGTYTDIDVYTIDGNAGDRMINVEFPRYNYIKVTYENSSGQGGGVITSKIGSRAL